jgi:ribosomal protein L7/L12
MKFTLTLTEAIRIVRNSINLPADIEIEITETGAFAASIPANVAIGLLRLIGGVETRLKDNNKIAAIKEYRSAPYAASIGQGLGLGVSIGLREAKDVIEHWEEAKRIILGTGKLVVPNYQPGSGYGDPMKFLTIG